MSGAVDYKLNIFRDRQTNMDIDPQAVKSGFDAIRSVFDALKAARDSFKSNPTTNAKFDNQIALAERELKLAEAQLALALGYPLCRAHFPPTPMLKYGVDSRTTDELFRCPECGLEQPSPEKLASIHRLMESGSHALKGSTRNVFDF